MLDPGTSLAIVSLALQVANGLLSYYELWNNCDEDVIEIQRSLLWLANIFAQLDITLQNPNLQEQILVIIYGTVNKCEKHVLELKELLGKVKKDGTPHGLRARFRDSSRRILCMFHSHEIQGLKGLLEGLKRDLDLAINVLNLHTSATSLSELRSFQDHMKSLKSSVEEASKLNNTSVQVRAKETKRAAILQWLAPCNVSIFHESACEQHEAGTGRWFLDGAPFRQWRFSDAQSLWIFGNVGCGKTILSASIIEELKIPNANPTLDLNKDKIIYFYFTFDDTNRQDLSAFLKSALAQLCPKDSALLQLDDLFWSCNPDPPSMRALQNALVSALKFFCGAVPIPDSESNDSAEQKVEEESELNHVYMVLDGLDEIPYGPQRAIVLRFLGLLSRLSLRRLHILATSRQERDIEEVLLTYPGWNLLSILQTNVEKDLGIYVASQIAENQKLQAQPDSIKDEIRRKLIFGAGGMFRWVALQMEELKKLRILRGRDVMNILSSLPKDLDATYDRILNSIDSTLAHEASSALQWLACASRPLFLEELAEACVIRPGEFSPFEEDQRLSPTDIPEVLPGLIKIEPAYDLSEGIRPRHHIISLAHFSVKEYLFSQRILTGPARNYKISSGLAQHHIAQSCLAYIAYCQSVPAEPPNVQQQRPLKLYAHSRWAVHAALVPAKLIDNICFGAISLFKAPGPCLDWCASANVSCRSVEENKPGWLRIPFSWYQTPRWPTDYLFCHAVLAGNGVLVQHLLETGFYAQCDHTLGRALKLAIQYGHSSIAQLLLAEGAYDAKALATALESRHESIVPLLLESTTQVRKLEVLLAVERCSASVVSLILSKYPNQKLSVILEAVDIALRKQKPETTHLLRAFLFSDTLCRNLVSQGVLIGDQSTLCTLVFRTAIRLDSQILTRFLLRSTPKGVLSLLDCDSLFLETIIEGSYRTAKALREYPWFRISKHLREFEHHWDRVVPHDVACLHVLAILHQVLRSGVTPFQNGIDLNNVTEKNWKVLRSATSIFTDFVQAISTKDKYAARIFDGKRIHGQKLPSDFFTNLRMPLSGDQRVYTYLILSRPHSPCIRSIYANEMIIRYKLGGSLGSPGADRSASTWHSDMRLKESLFFDDIPWEELLSSVSTPPSNSDDDFPVHPSFHARGFDIEVRKLQRSMVTSWPAQLTFPPMAFWTHDPIGDDSNTQMKKGTSNPLQIQRIRMELELQPQEYIRDRLQLASPYFMILDGLITKTTQDDAQLWSREQGCSLFASPRATVYQELLVIDLDSESREDISRWRQSVQPFLDEAHFMTIDWPFGCSCSRCARSDDGSPDHCCQTMGLVAECSEWYETVWRGLEDMPNAKSCVRYLEALLRSREDEWGLEWSNIDGDTKEVEYPPPRTIQNDTIATVDEARALMKLGGYDFTVQTTLGNDLEASKRSNTTRRLKLTITAPRG